MVSKRSLFWLAISSACLSSSGKASTPCWLSCSPATTINWSGKNSKQSAAADSHPSNLQKREDDETADSKMQNHLKNIYSTQTQDSPGQVKGVRQLPLQACVRDNQVRSSQRSCTGPELNPCRRSQDAVQHGYFYYLQQLQQRVLFPNLFYHYKGMKKKKAVNACSSLAVQTVVPMNGAPSKHADKLTLTIS